MLIMRVTRQWQNIATLKSFQFYQSASWSRLLRDVIDSRPKKRVVRDELREKARLSLWPTEKA